MARQKKELRLWNPTAIGTMSCLHALPGRAGCTPMFARERTFIAACIQVSLDWFWWNLLTTPDATIAKSCLSPTNGRHSLVRRKWKKRKMKTKRSISTPNKPNRQRERARGRLSPVFHQRQGPRLWRACLGPKRRTGFVQDPKCERDRKHPASAARP